MNKKTKIILIVAFIVFMIIIFIMNIRIKQTVHKPQPALKIKESDLSTGTQLEGRSTSELEMEEEKQEAPVSAMEPLLE